ncbi:MAG: competence protein ComE [Hydrogenophilales bacterium 16-64-46]|nr:MAG: competence protein ComE [Hydrogenophilales bacterium 12-64-13]OYZ05689.1 MAG: competence protein ComE [Hydrogenophilales bacterium 16-64-46]OZA40024.1 MAG: competence protein ComE [Hydrogenophilales bacterium 17-64-34]HQT00889.1 helix-hairpin-helix domain-containing protein [Thiobacillus sp.]
MKKILSTILLGVLCAPVWAVVDLNTATQSELEAVKGLGPAKARAIILYRQENGKFKSVDELDGVKGFGKATVDKLRGELTVGKEAEKGK